MLSIEWQSRIISNTDGVLVINKPHDIPTSGKSLDDPDAVQFWIMKLQGRMIWAVHQLDADTTGVNLFVTEKKRVGQYQEAMNNPLAKKIYLAIVHGNPEWSTVDCSESIGYISERSLGVTSTGKYACSRFTKIDSTEHYSLVQVEIVTGRTHQIRIHLNHLGFPLVGDDWYTDQPVRQHFRQALHAWKIELPSLQQFFEAPIPEDFLALMVRLGLKCDSKV